MNILRLNICSQQNSLQFSQQIYLDIREYDAISFIQQEPLQHRTYGCEDQSVDRNTVTILGDDNYIVVAAIVQDFLQ